MLQDELLLLSPDLLSRLAKRGFDERRLVAWAAAVGVDRDARNRLTGRVEPPQIGDVTDAPVLGTPDYQRLSELGDTALRAGQVALCVLAGGMATRMGGVVKALVEALPGRDGAPGPTFLDLRLGENRHLAARGAHVPLWLMTSEATEGPIRAALSARGAAGHIATFEQFVSLRLTPQGGLFRGDDGAPSVYPTGHGDLPDALRASGLLSAFVAGGGKHVWIANLDNLGATVDPAILGWHLSRGGPLTVELVDKVGSDRGGGPVRHNGRLLIAEEFRLPAGFDPTTVPVFNTNTFLVDAVALAGLTMEWTYVEVDKKIGGAKAVQCERLIGELTRAFEPQLLRVPREGIASRFLPVKDVAELDGRRGEIDAVARARGMFP